GSFLCASSLPIDGAICANARAFYDLFHDQSCVCRENLVIFIVRPFWSCVTPDVNQRGFGLDRKSLDRACCRKIKIPLSRIVASVSAVEYLTLEFPPCILVVTGNRTNYVAKQCFL